MYLVSISEISIVSLVHCLQMFTHIQGTVHFNPVRLVNSAIINEKMAMTILPLAAVFHQVSGCVSVTRNKCTQDTVVLHRFAYNSMMQHD